MGAALARVAWSVIELRSFPVYAQALERARSSPQVLEGLGQPLKVGWLPHGKVSRSGQDIRAEMTIPVSGSNGKGRICVLANRHSGSWNLATLVVRLDEKQQIIDLLPPTVYLVPLGKPTEWSPDPLVDYYHRTLGIHAVALPWVPLGSDVEDSARHQVVAERLLDLMKKSEPALAEDADALLIGITQRDMYIADFGWPSAINFRHDQRFAVISLARLRGDAPTGGDDFGVLEGRLRKTVTKNIGLLYYHLSLSQDPTSVMSLLDPTDEDAVDRLDGSSDDLIGVKGVWDPLPGSGDPCVTVTQPRATAAWWGLGCDHLPPADTSAQSFQNDMRLSLFELRQTDFYFDEPLPLWLVRIYRPYDNVSRAFGIGTNHSFDIYLTGDVGRFSHIDLILEDGARIHFVPESPEKKYTETVYHSNETWPSPFVHSALRWNGNGWDLKRPDGWTFVFPTIEATKRSQQLAPVGIHDDYGHAFTLRRDAHSNLLSVRSPSDNTLDFSYDSGRRITSVRASNGRSVSYAYDAAGRLASVVASDGQCVQYTYDPENEMLTVRDGDGRALLTNQYDSEDCLVRQTLADGRVLTYSCLRRSDRRLSGSDFTDPRGFVIRFRYHQDAFTHQNANTQSWPEFLPVPPSSITRRRAELERNGFGSPLNNEPTELSHRVAARASGITCPRFEPGQAAPARCRLPWSGRIVACRK
jgi:YD repeat-containing protein